MARYKKLRQHRYDKLKSELFTSSEARAMSAIAFKQPYIKDMRKERQSLARATYKYIKRNKLSGRNFLPLLKDRIEKEYRKNGWKDIWAMIRDYRGKSLARGDYQPPPRKKRDRLNRGNVAAQKARYRARQARIKERQTGVTYDVSGNPIGRVVYNSTSGKFEVTND